MTPLFPPGDEPDANASARTETAQRVLSEARRILAEVKDGHNHSEERRQWAATILGMNAIWGQK